MKSHVLFPLLIFWLLAGGGHPHLADAQDCSPVSLLPCQEVVKGLPFHLNFDSPSGGLVDSNNTGTGFTMALPHSRERLGDDLPVTYPAVNGFEPSRLLVKSDGTLTVTSNKGIAYLNRSDASSGGRTNTQVNTLGIGFELPAEMYTLQTTLHNPMLKGDYAQQTGLWIGSDDDNFIKLVLEDEVGSSNEVEFRKEVTGSSRTQDGIVSGDISNTSFSKITLTLKIDPVAKTATAYYQLDNGTENLIGNLSLPDLYQKGVPFAGKEAILFAGIFATHRNAPAPFQVAFEDFAVSSQPKPPIPEPVPETEPGSKFSVKINFQDQATATPAGYMKDVGEPYGKRNVAEQGGGAFTYGWISSATGQPVDLTGQARNRLSTGITDVVLATLVHMENPYASQSGYWEMAVPNGAYEVSVGVGDAAVGKATEIHRINAEGINIIENFVPFGSAGSITRFSSNTKQVAVSDGKLTLDYSGGGVNTKLTFVKIQQISDQPSEGSYPYVTKVTPADHATKVPLTQSVTVDLQFPNQVSLDVTTVTNQTVLLYQQSNGNQILVTGTVVNATGGGDAITLSARLLENTEYIFEITDQVKDLKGYGMVPFTSSFTTGMDIKMITDLSDIKFKEQVLIDDDFGDNGFTSLAIGPDYRLYAVTSSGTIERWDIQQDGTLQQHITIKPFGEEKRLAINLAFDPKATATNLIAWMSHTTYGFQQMPEGGGKISKLNLNNPDGVKVTDYVINLPRSSKDHVTNGIDFGPDKALYFTQGSNSGMGDPDPAWGNRKETLLSGALLRLDVKAQELSGKIPLDVKNGEAGLYDPYAPGALLTIYATGVRNAYDLVWHSNGELYVPTNGSAAGSNVPGLKPGTIRYDGTVYEGPEILPIVDLRQTQRDFLFHITEGGYYGHPNPARKEYIMNGGNPTADKDPAEVVDGTDPAKGYPVGTMPELHYHGFAYDFGPSKSPNGIIEYKSSAFGGKLKGKLMVCRFSGGDDIFIMEPGGINLDIVATVEGDVYGKGPGKNGLRRPYYNPLTLVEDEKTGNLYISEYFTGNEDGEPRITLLRPDIPANSLPELVLNHREILLTDKTSSGAGMSQPLTLSNKGNKSLIVHTLIVEGADRSQFKILNAPSLPTTLQPGGTLTMNLALETNTSGNKNASLKVLTSLDTVTVNLKGIGHQEDEPSLQYIVNAHDIPLSVGDDDPTTAIIHSVNYRNTALGEEVKIPLFKKVTGSIVHVDILGVFGPQGSNGITTGFGWYLEHNPASAQEILTVNNKDHASLMVNAEGSVDFNPGDKAFGLYSRWPYFNDRYLFQEDALNTFQGAVPHHVRVYPFRDAQGKDVLNAYVVAFEEHIQGFDYQDIVLIVRNVEPYVATTPQLAFSPLSVEKSVATGKTPDPVSVKLTTNGNGTTTQLTDPKVSWLKLSAISLATGSNVVLTFNTANLQPNQYNATITATADGYQPAKLDVKLTVTSQQTASSIYINYQDANAAPPAPYLVDYGQSYGIRSGVNQGQGLQYGWVKPGTQTPLDLQGNGRNRKLSQDAVRETLMHMQYQQAKGASSSKGVLAEGAWEIAVPNGQYQVTVTGGDTHTEGTEGTRHYINVEGVNVLDFSPLMTGVKVATQTVLVTVEDGKLTIDAQNGGFNTKIIAAVITPQNQTTVGPDVTMTVKGDTDHSGAYLNMAQVTLKATPQGSATSAQVVAYQINNQPAQTYQGPFTIEEAGVYAVSATASDNKGNFTTKKFPPFEVKSGVLTGAGIALENMTKIPKTSIAVPYDDRFVFHFILNPRSTNKAIHNQNTVRIRNTGVNDLIVKALNFSHPDEFTLVNEVPVQLPLHIPAGGYFDLTVKYIGRQGDQITVDYRTLDIVSNADNDPTLTATLACGFMPFSQGNNELNAQQVLDIFGFKTDIRQTLPNGTKTLRPSSVYPAVDRVNSGKEGDLILSKTFVQADPGKPVEAYQLAAFKGAGSATVKLADTVSGTTTVAGFTFKFDEDYHQSLLPKSVTSNQELAGDHASVISVPFILNSAGYTTLGKNFNSSGDPTVLGVRVYKVYDRNGELRSNEYIMIQDNVANGCGAGTANCDWNDVMVYFRNIRPENVPFALHMPDLWVKAGTNFTFDAAAYFNLGYPGNQLTYRAYMKADASNIPAWMSLNPNTGVLNGTAPNQNGYQVTIAINGTDLNGLDAFETLTVHVGTAPVANARKVQAQATQVSDTLAEAREMTQEIQIYPNPFAETINMSFPAGYDPEVIVSLVDMAGKVVDRITMTIGPAGEEKVWHLSKEGLDPGLYFLKVASLLRPPQIFRILKK